MASENIYDYFEKTLDATCGDESLKSLPIDSPCGADCRAVIDGAKTFLSLCDTHPGIRIAVLKATRLAVSIYWAG